MEASSFAPSSSESPLFERRCNVPVRYVPLGKWTAPPASMARWIAAVSSVLPSPFAPNAVTSAAFPSMIAAENVNGIKSAADARLASDPNMARMSGINGKSGSCP